MKERGRFLFESDSDEGNATRVLYTGDLRAEPRWREELRECPVMRTSTGKPKFLNRLYLDTTAINSRPDSPPSPSKSTCIAEIIKLVARYIPTPGKPQTSHTAAPRYLIHLQSRCLGYEEIWFAVARHFRQKIHVCSYWSAIHRSYARRHGFPRLTSEEAQRGAREHAAGRIVVHESLADWLTDDPDETQLHACHFYAGARFCATCFDAEEKGLLVRILPEKTIDVDESDESDDGGREPKMTRAWSGSRVPLARASTGLSRTGSELLTRVGAGLLLRRANSGPLLTTRAGMMGDEPAVYRVSGVIEQQPGTLVFHVAFRMHSCIREMQDLIAALRHPGVFQCVEKEGAKAAFVLGCSTVGRGAEAMRRDVANMGPAPAKRRLSVAAEMARTLSGGMPSGFREVGAWKAIGGGAALQIEGGPITGDVAVKGMEDGGEGVIQATIPMFSRDEDEGSDDEGDDESDRESDQATMRMGNDDADEVETQYNSQTLEDEINEADGMAAPEEAFIKEDAIGLTWPQEEVTDDGGTAGLVPIPRLEEGDDTSGYKADEEGSFIEEASVQSAGFELKGVVVEELARMILPEKSLMTEDEVDMARFQEGPKGDLAEAKYTEDVGAEVGYDIAQCKADEEGAVDATAMLSSAGIDSDDDGAKARAGRRGHVEGLMKKVEVCIARHQMEVGGGISEAEPTEDATSQVGDGVVVSKVDVEEAASGEVMTGSAGFDDVAMVGAAGVLRMAVKNEMVEEASGAALEVRHICSFEDESESGSSAVKAEVGEMMLAVSTVDVLPHGDANVHKSTSTLAVGMESHGPAAVAVNLRSVWSFEDDSDTGCELELGKASRAVMQVDATYYEAKGEPRSEVSTMVVDTEDRGVDAIDADDDSDTLSWIIDLSGDNDDCDDRERPTVTAAVNMQIDDEVAVVHKTQLPPSVLVNVPIVTGVVVPAEPKSALTGVLVNVQDKAKVPTRRARSLHEAVRRHAQVYRGVPEDFRLTLTLGRSYEKIGDAIMRGIMKSAGGIGGAVRKRGPPPMLRRAKSDQGAAVLGAAPAARALYRTASTPSGRVS